MTKQDEDSFPRGGAINIPTTKRRLPKYKTEKELFSTAHDEDGPKRKKSKNRHVTLGQKVDKKKAADRTLDTIIKKSLHIVSHLSVSSCPVNMLLLGCVKEVKEYHLNVSLPNGINGQVPITAISTAYTGLLQHLAAGDYSVATELKGLKVLFTQGMVIRCKITEVKSKGKSSQVGLTINPRDVNSSLQGSNLKSGMVLCGCIASVEEHGYTVDLGVTGIIAFLKKASTEQYILEYNDGKALHVGSYLHCMISADDKMDIMTGESRTVNVTIDPRKAFRAEVELEMGLTMNTLIPGMRVSATVKKISKTGISVNFLSYTGTISSTHLMKSPKALHRGEELKACVLYVHPVTKVVALSCQLHLVTPDLSPRKLFGDLRFGNVVEEAKIIKVIQTVGVYLKLNDRVTGFAHLGNLSDGTVTNANQVFSKGDTVSCRVMNFDYSDNLAMVTLRESILNRQFLNYDEIQPVQDLEVEVTAVNKGGISVVIANHIKGFIPRSMTANVPLKHPGKRFVIGDKINARVLSLEDRKKQVILTTKKSILNSKYLRLSDYSQAHGGLVIEGVINKIVEQGIGVLFYNKVKGFVPKVNLASEFTEDMKKAFYIGQIVRVQVVKCVPDERNLLLSMKIFEKGPPPITLPEGMHVGQLIDEVVVNQPNPKGFYVTFPNTSVKGFLPTAHLSDHIVNTDLLHKIYKKGDAIQDCAVLSLDKNRIIITNKPCLVSAAKAGSLVKSFEDIKLGMNVAGVVRNCREYGVFVDLSSGVIALAPIRFLFDEMVPDPSNMYSIGQSVVAKVSEVNEEKKRVLVSLRMKDCYYEDLSVGIDLLENYLHEYHKLLQHHKQEGEKQALASHSIGSVIKVTITKVTDLGVLCELEDGTKALATEDNIQFVTCVVGNRFPAVVLYVDLVGECLEVALSSNLVSTVQRLTKTKFAEVKIGQVIKSDVLLIKDGFVLIALRGHALGQLAYLPSKLHLNDMMEQRQYQVTQKNTVLIKRISKYGIFASLVIHAPTKKDKAVAKHHLVPGVHVEAKVISVNIFQVNIVIGDTHGRVHISELADKVKEGSTPVLKIKVNEMLRVKVIGYRHPKTKLHIPISDPKIFTALPECSIRPSLLESESECLLPSEDVQMADELCEGDLVTVYIQSMQKDYLIVQVTPKVRGKIQRQHISDKVSIRDDPLTHYQIGKAYKATVIGPGRANILDLSFMGNRKNIAVMAGAIAQGTVRRSSKMGVIVSLYDGFVGLVSVTEIMDDYKDYPWMAYREGLLVTVYVINCAEPDHCVLSLRDSRVFGTKLVADPILSVDNVHMGAVVRGYVSNNLAHDRLFVSLGRDLGACVMQTKIIHPMPKNRNKLFYVGKVVRGKVMQLKAGKKALRLSLLESDIEGTKDGVSKISLKRETVESEEDITPKKRKVMKSNVKQTGTQRLAPNSQVMKSNVKQAGTQRLALSGGFTWEADVAIPPPNSHANDDSDSEDDDEGGDKKKKTRKSRAERMAAHREEERHLVESERQLASLDSTPQNAEQFDRLVMQSPHSSMVWLAYMAHHLESTEIEKARAVAERALKTISFREEQEKLNVWLAYLNLENMYGTPEFLKLVFERAVALNDSFKIHNQMAGIYDSSKKLEEADSMHQTMLRRFGSMKEVWINYGLFLFKHNRGVDAHKLLQRSIKCIDTKQHIEVLSKFAQMEFKHGAPERGCTMFENILSSYKRRTDLWSIYLDMVIKQGQHQQTRSIFERVVGLNFAAKKMKFFFKKQLDFEQKFGTEETVASVKQKALDYVESRAALT